jgi:UDP-glucose 4-epimerase
MKPLIIITGHEGYIGRHLRKMMADRYTIMGIDNHDMYNSLDITRPLPAFPEAHTVIHLAALVNVGTSVQMPTAYYNTNCTGTINVLRSLRYQNFIFASTGSAEYQQSPYARSKRMAEDIVTEHLHDRDHTIFRFYNVTGSDGIKPTNPDALMASLIRASESGVFHIYGTDYDTPDGTAIRDYVHVNDICRALITAIDKPARGLENLGTGVGTSVAQMANMFQQVNQISFGIRPEPRRAGDLPVSVLDKPSDYLQINHTLEDLLRMPNS